MIYGSTAIRPKSQRMLASSTGETVSSLRELEALLALARKGKHRRIPRENGRSQEIASSLPFRRSTYQAMHQEATDPCIHKASTFLRIPSKSDQYDESPSPRNTR